MLSIQNIFHQEHYVVLADSDQVSSRQHVPGGFLPLANGNVPIDSRDPQIHERQYCIIFAFSTIKDDIRRQVYWLTMHCREVHGVVQ